MTVPVESHVETWPLFSEPIFERIRRHAYLINKETLGEITIRNQLKTVAAFATERHEVHVRFAWHEGAAYLDLATSSWEQVKITADGWSVINNLESPVKFIRTSSMRPLPYPQTGGSLETIRDILSLGQNEHEWVMLVSWLVGTFQPDGAYPILFMHGEQGSAKSTATRLIRSLVDPCAGLLRSLPRNEHDLAISASGSWILSYDNVSSLPANLSDAFCKLATGGGFATRKLYTDDEEVVFDSKRPIIMNGITNFAQRQDLVDRGVFVNMPAIFEKNRKTERDVWRQWETAKPGVLGALCDAVAAGLRSTDTVSMFNPPRMADFARWVVAAEPGLPWEQGRFLEEYKRNRFLAQEIALEAEPVALAILEFMDTRDAWTGTASELLTILSHRVPMDQRGLPSWPKAPHILSGKIRRQLFTCEPDKLMLNSASQGPGALLCARWKPEVSKPPTGHSD